MFHLYKNGFGKAAGCPGVAVKSPTRESPGPKFARTKHRLASPGTTGCQLRFSDMCMQVPEPPVPEPIGPHPIPYPPPMPKPPAPKPQTVDAPVGHCGNVYATDGANLGWREYATGLDRDRPPLLGRNVRVNLSMPRYGTGHSQIGVIVAFHKLDDAVATVVTWLVHQGPGSTREPAPCTRPG